MRRTFASLRSFATPPPPSTSTATTATAAINCPVVRTAFLHRAATPSRRALWLGASTALVLAGWTLGQTLAWSSGSGSPPTATATSSPPTATATTPVVGKKVMISGGPGGGKGTQSELIIKHYGLIHVSTGDLLRDEVKRGTPEGKTAKEFMDKGALVPQSLMEPMVQRRLTAPDCVEKGWLLDGYPRELPAAEFMTRAGLVADVFLVLEVPDEILVQRLSGRVTDPVTKITYHMTLMPPPADPVVRARLTQRSDDTVGAARARIDGYKRLIEPVIAFYRGSARGPRIVSVDGNREVAAVFADVARILGPSPLPITAASVATAAQQALVA